MATLEPTLPILPIWLWPEGENVRLWTPDHTHVFSGLTSAMSFDDLRRACRDNHDQYNLEKMLCPKEFAQTLAKILRNQDVRPILYLADTLGNGVQMLPYEWLWLDSRRLSRLTVSRFTRLTPDTTSPTAPGPVYVVDLWPQEPGVARPLRGLVEQHPQATVLLGPEASRKRLETLHPDNYAALIVLCHGKEVNDEDSTPFLDPNGAPWPLPTGNGLPALVILLACGTEEGNLLRYGRNLLQHGARTILAPLGKIDVAEARRFLDLFLQQWFDEKRVDEALLTAQEVDANHWGARRLTIIGDPGLRRAATPRLEEMANDDLARLCKDQPTLSAKALSLLVHRLTLACFQRGEGLHKPRARLSQLFEIGDDDETGQEWLYHRLEEMIRTCPPGRLTQVWLYPWQGQGAEHHEHERLDFYERQRIALRPVADLMPITAYHDWNRIAYRNGRYGQALEDVLLGLQALPKDQLWSEGAPLVRDIANLLIEFDLAESALKVVTWVVERLTSEPPSDARDYELHALLDTQARGHLRKGKQGWRTALVLFKKKRRDAMNRCREDGQRELAWLLYTAAWGDPGGNEAKSYAGEVRNLLNDRANFRQSLQSERGNSNCLYLLRAIAAWVWRSGSTADAQLLLSYKDVIGQDLHREDPGPLGFVVGYLQLHAQDTGEPLPDECDWNAARELLRAKRYYLEVTAFDALLGKAPEARESLQSYQRASADILNMLDQAAASKMVLKALGVKSQDIHKWAKRLKARQRIERKQFNKVTKATPSDLLTEGLLPL